MVVVRPEPKDVPLLHLLQQFLRDCCESPGLFHLVCIFHRGRYFRRILNGLEGTEIFYRLQKKRIILSHTKYVYKRMHPELN